MERIISDDIDAILRRDLEWSRFSASRVVVTGAGGFLGGMLVRTLLALHDRGKTAKPVEVVAMVRNTESAMRRFASLRGASNLQIVEWNLNSIAVPEIGEAHYVFHVASQASPRFYGADPVGTLLPNSVGTAALLESLRRASDPRGFLFVSSSEVYGSVKSDIALSESSYGEVDPMLKRSCYAESKKMGETTCVAWFHQFGLPTFIVRPFHTYGPGLTPGDGRVFADFAFNVAAGQNIKMNSDGRARRAFCYVSDAIAGFFAVLLRGRPATAYNVANPSGELSVIELAEMLVALYPEKNLSVEVQASTDSRYLPSVNDRIIPNIDRILSVGWRPEVEPAKGFRRMVDAIGATA